MKEITTVDLQQMIEAGKPVTIIDVREVSEVANGKIKGSVNMPLGLVEFRMNELDKKQPYYIICHAGGRSAQATAYLDDQGYDVTNVAGGMSNWQGDIE